MKGQILLSEEWCELVFEGRNKEYGAYVLRRDAGRRYRRVAMLLGSIFGVMLIFAAVAGFFVYQAVVDRMEEIEQELNQLEPLKKDEVKAVSAGRRAVKGTKQETAKESPEVVDERVAPSLPIGISLPDDIEVTDASELRNDKDIYHNTDQRDLPVEGAQLVETEKVEEMPKFPGGLDALMKFIDQNVAYPASLIRQKVEGEVMVAFIIDAEGKLIEPEITKKLHPSLDNAVMTAIRRMPKWQPGKVNGKPANVKVCIPVHFQVQ